LSCWRAFPSLTGRWLGAWPSRAWDRREYWGAWERRANPARLHIEGTKRRSRVRDVPLWVSWLPAVPARSRSRFVAVWRAHLSADLGIYDLRRFFAVWMEDAGIPRSRQRLYMGRDGPCGRRYNGVVSDPGVAILAAGRCRETWQVRRPLGARTRDVSLRHSPRQPGERGSDSPRSSLSCNTLAPLAQLAEQVTLNH
jgi:hypothetical protein